MLEVKNITKEFTKKINKKDKISFLADDNISFKAKQGEIVGILGPNGAGKTTLLRIISGIMEPTKGTITIDNMNYQDNEIEIKNQDFIIQDGGNITSNIDLGINTDIYKVANMNLIDTIEENGERKEQDYSLIIYIVKKDDTLWNIAKQFGSTVDDIARTNGIENRDLIMPGQKLYIPKYIKTPAIVNG